MDISLTLTIPDAKVVDALRGFLKTFPNEEKNMADGTPKYTDKQWIKEKLRRILISTIRLGLQTIASENAVVVDDNGMAI